MASKRKVVKPELTESQLAYKAELSSIQSAIKVLLKQHTEKKRQCPHAIAYEVDSSAWCELCGEDFGWHCPSSPDHCCHYFSERTAPGMEPVVKLNNGGTAFLSSEHSENQAYETDDVCLFCGDPQERK